MEELKKRYQQLLQAYKRLEYMRTTFVQLSVDDKKLTLSQENELITHRDALIKRFGFCYDLTWKFFKLVLKKKYSIDVSLPRKVFQECYEQELLSKEDSIKLINLIDDRNDTVHVYDEEMANQVSKKIIEHYQFLYGIVKKFESK